MKKKIIISVCFLLISVLIAASVLSASAAVYVQDGNFKYQIIDDGTVAWAGYTSETVDDVVVPRYYDQSKVVSVANFALENNDKIRSVDFMEAPDLSKIGMYAFSGCSSIESVIVPNSITTVDVSAFRNCALLQNVEFYGNNNVVPVECFYECAALKNVRLSAYLTTIKSRAFAGCTSLEYLELPDTIQSISSNAFNGCDNLILGVWSNSYAQEYAIGNSMPYILLDGPKTGDVNGDGVVDIFDATEIQKFAAEKIIFTDEQFELADINKDGYVDVMDALLVQKSVIGKYDIPPIIYNS